MFPSAAEERVNARGLIYSSVQFLAVKLGKLLGQVS